MAGYREGAPDHPLVGSDLLTDVAAYLDGCTNLEPALSSAPLPEHERSSSLLILTTLADSGGFRPILDELLELDPLFDAKGRQRYSLASVLAECDRISLRNRVHSACNETPTHADPPGTRAQCE